MKQGVLTMAEWLLLSKGHFYSGPRNPTHSHCTCTVSAKLSVLNCLKKEGGSGRQILLCLCGNGPSRIWKLFDLFAEGDVHQHVVRKSVNKEGKKPRTRLQHPVTSFVLQRKHQLYPLKKQHVRRNKKAAEYAKLLPERMKEAKEKGKNRLPRDIGYPH